MSDAFRQARRSGATAVRVLAVATLVATLPMAGCGDGDVSNGAPPWVVCGTTLWSSASGAVVTDATTPGGTVRVGNLTSGGIALLVSRDCDRGSDVIVPEGAATVTRSAASKDGRVAALMLTPRRADFTITVAHPGASSSAVVVSLDTNFTGSSS